MLRLPVEAFSAVFTKYPESLVRVVQVSGAFRLPPPAPTHPRLLQAALISPEQSDLWGPLFLPLAAAAPFSPGFCHLIVGFSLAHCLPLASPLLLPTLTFPTVPPR